VTSRARARQIMGNDALGGSRGKARSICAISAGESAKDVDAALSATWAMSAALGMVKIDGRRVRKRRAT
jgi:hypothetical protein